MKTQVGVTSKPKGSPRGSASAGVGFLVAAMSMVAIAQLAARSSAAMAQQAVEYQAVRAPRVYNALITSDQSLLPSRADPVVAPVFRPFRYYYDWPGVYVSAVGPERSSADGGRDVTVAPASAGTEQPAATPPAEDGRAGTRPPFVKNNGPAADAKVSDVPPPPLPVSAPGNRDKKKPTEYPPAPVGFAM